MVILILWNSLINFFLWAFCKQISHIPNTPHPEHPTFPTSDISKIPHRQYLTSRTSHISDIPHPEHLTPQTSHILNIPHHKQKEFSGTIFFIWLLQRNWNFRFMKNVHFIKFSNLTAMGNIINQINVILLFTFLFDIFLKSFLVNKQ